MTDSVAGRHWIDENCGDLLITDIQMPEIPDSGDPRFRRSQMPEIKVLEMLIFANQRNAWSLVIFMTAFLTWDRISEAAENVASDYLLKPVQQKKLVSLIERECGRILRW